MTPSHAINFVNASILRAGTIAATVSIGLAVVMILEAASPAQAHSPRGRERQTEKKKEKKIPAGPLLIAVNIAAQRVTLYANGEIVTRSAVSTGTRGHPTPTGVFSVIQKNKWHRSNIYSGAPMPYMQRITWSGIAMHQGPLPGYPASHGCIRLTGEFARMLWSTTKMGARVVVSHAEVAPVAFAHSRLFAPKSEPESPPPAARETVAASTGTKPAAGTSAEDLLAAAEASLRTAALQANEETLSLVEAAQIKAARRKGPISVFISRKTKKLYARQAFEPLFEMPVTIAGPEQPLGTHVFTAMEAIEDGAAIRWTALSMPPERPRADRNARQDRDYSSRRKQREKPAPQSVPLPSLTAAEALDRIDIPQEARERIADLLMPGSSLIISDHGLGDETGEGTDFIVLTRS